MSTGIGRWDWYDRNSAVQFKNDNWGGWDASDADYFGKARSFFEGHKHWKDYIGDYGSKDLFSHFGGEGALINPPKMPKNSGSRTQWSLGEKYRKLAADIYFYEKGNPLAPPEPEPAPAAAAPVAPATPPPPVEPQKIDLSQYISQDQLAQYQSEWQTQAQNQYQSDLASQQAEMAAYAADQLSQTQSSLSDQYAHALKQAESDWSSELGLAKNQWAETAAKEQQDIRSSLLDDFKTERAAQDRVYDSQVSELRDMYLGKESGWQDTLNTYETALATQKSAWDSQIGDYESAIGGFQSTIGDYKTQIGGFQDLISGQQATIGEIEKARAEQSGQLKVYQEQAMRDAERARVAATYGKSGKPMNQDVKGVKTLNELPSDRPKFRSSFFNRGGSRIKNTSLNI